jgi:hypothetical protein
MGLKSQAELVNCPNCNVEYRLVRAEAGPETSYGQIECYHCGGPLNGREGQFILKYFLVKNQRKRAKSSRVK